MYGAFVSVTNSLPLVALANVAGGALPDQGWQAINTLLLIILALVGGRQLQTKASQKEVDSNREQIEGHRDELKGEIQQHRDRVEANHQRIFTLLDEQGKELREIYEKIMDDPRTPGSLH